MERIRDDKKVIAELKERQNLQEFWELHEAGIRSSEPTWTTITPEETHNLLENMPPFEKYQVIAQKYYEYSMQMIKMTIEGVNSENSFVSSQDILKKMNFLEEIEVLKRALEINEQKKKSKGLSLTRRKIRENI